MAATLRSSSTRKYRWLGMLLGGSLMFLGLAHWCLSTPPPDAASGGGASVAFEALSGLSVFKSSQTEISYAVASDPPPGGGKALQVGYTLREGEKPFIGFVVKDLGHAVDWSRYDAVSFWSRVPKPAADLKDLSVLLYQEDGAAYIAQFARKLTQEGWERSTLPFSSFVYSSGGGFFKRKSDPLDPRKIRKVALGIYQPVPFSDRNFTFQVAQFTPVRSQSAPSAERPPEEGRAHAAATKGGRDRNATIDPLEAPLRGWRGNVAQNVALSYALDGAGKQGDRKRLKLNYRFDDKKPFWGFAEKEFGSARDWRSYHALHLSSYLPVPARDLSDFSVVLYEEGGGAYIAQQVRSLKKAGWEEATVPFSRFYPAGEWAKDDNGRLDLDRIKKVGFGIFQPGSFSDRELTLYLSDLRAVSAPSRSAPTASAPAVRKSPLQKLEPPDGSVYQGLFAYSAPQKGWGGRKEDWEKQIDPEQIAQFERASGKAAAIASFVWFLDWEFPVELCRKVDALGKVPHLGVTSGALKPTDIVQGRVDKKLGQWARAAKGYGKPVFLRFFPEMNGNWNSYSEARDPAQSHETYVRAWRHVVSAFRKAGATNVVWVWAPTAVDVGSVHWADYYPGDDYVDWVGVSVYSFLGDGDPQTQIMALYNDYAERKPIMIAECAAGGTERDPRRYRTGSGYADNPEKWIDRFFDTLEAKAPRVKAFVWFNIDRERVWKIQESQSKTDRYRKRVMKSRYLSRIQ